MSRVNQINSRLEFQVGSQIQKPFENMKLHLLEKDHNVRAIPKRVVPRWKKLTDDTDVNEDDLELLNVSLLIFSKMLKSSTIFDLLK